jgi:acyl-CoA synthetase (AMP-forming)/AMP-acid ligase II
MYPAEVEQVLAKVPGVEDAAVVGIDDRQYGQVMAAFVVGSATEAAVERAAKRDLASFKVPRLIRVVDDLPRTSTGKVLRHELAELAADGSPETSRSKRAS